MKIARLFLIIVYVVSSLPVMGEGLRFHGEEQVEDSVEEHENPYDALVKQGMDALVIDSMRQAEDCFLQALKQFPHHQSNFLLYRYLGQIREHQNRGQEALEFYTSGLDLNPTNLELRLDRAAWVDRLGNDGRAISDYSDVLDQEPDNIEALNMRAHLYSRIHDYKRARTDYEHIIRLEPLNERAYVGLILVNDRSGRPREAMEQIDALISVYPKHALLYAIRGGMEHRRMEYEQALADLSRAVEMEPTNVDFLVSRATLYLDMRKRKLASADVQAALRLGADPLEMASLLKR